MKVTVDKAPLQACVRLAFPRDKNEGSSGERGFFSHHSDTCRDPLGRRRQPGLRGLSLGKRRPIPLNVGCGSHSSRGPGGSGVDVRLVTPLDLSMELWPCPEVPTGRGSSPGAGHLGRHLECPASASAEEQPQPAPARGRAETQVSPTAQQRSQPRAPHPGAWRAGRRAVLAERQAPALLSASGRCSRPIWPRDTY